MLDITRATFETDIIQASMTTPVLVDFWHPKSEQCLILVPLLEKLEIEYAGRFILAKVDASQEQDIAGAFGVQSIPTCILMMGGKPVDGFQGALTEGKIKEFLDKHLPPAEELPAEDELMPEAVTPEAAMDKLKADVANDPTNESARFELVKALLLGGDTDAAKVAFAPVIAQTTTVRRFDSLKRMMDATDFVAARTDETSATAEFDAKIALNKRDFEARFDKARWHMAHQDWTAALDELLDILMRDKAWDSDKARKTYIAILDIMEAPKPKVADGQIPPDDPVVATYRRRLSSVILS